MHIFSKLYHAHFVCLSKGQTSVVLSSIFCLDPVPNIYSTTPVEVLLELLFLTRNPSLLVLKIHSIVNFLKMLTDVDHDNLRTPVSFNMIILGIDHSEKVEKIFFHVIIVYMLCFKHDDFTRKSVRFNDLQLINNS